MYFCPETNQILEQKQVVINQKFSLQGSKEVLCDIYKLLIKHPSNDMQKIYLSIQKIQIALKWLAF